MHIQSSCLQHGHTQVVQAFTDKARSHPEGGCHLFDWMDHRAGPNRFSQSSGCPPTTAASHIRFRKGVAAVGAAKATFHHHHIDAILSQHQISFDSLPAIMHVIAGHLTLGAYGFVPLRDDPHVQTPIQVPFLAQHVEFRQIEGNDDSFFPKDFPFSVFSGMLIWQGLFLLILAFFLLPSSTKNESLSFFSFLLVLLSSSVPPKDGEPFLLLVIFTNQPLPAKLAGN